MMGHNSLIMHDRSDVSDPLQVTDNVTWFLSSIRTFPYFFNIDFPINSS